MAEEQDERDLKQRLLEAKLAGIKLDDEDDFHYCFRSNEQATTIALEEVELWLRDLAAAESAKAEATRSITRKRALRSAAERYHVLADDISKLRV